MALDDFIIRAVLAGFAVALASGPLGALVIWRRMAFFGDAVAHASVLGVGLALLWSLPIGLATFGVALGVGALVAWLIDRGQTGDAALGVISHSALALGLVVVSLLPNTRVNLEGFLFGDILTVTGADLVLIWGGAVAILAVLAWRWQALLVSSISEDIAAAAGVSSRRERMVLTLLLALLVAISLKVVGALLIAAMLIIPAAGARLWARGPETMAVGAMGIGIVAVVSGLAMSFWYDSPAGPSIVTGAAICYAISLGIGRMRG